MHMQFFIGVLLVREPCNLGEFLDRSVGLVVDVLHAEESGAMVEGPLVSRFSRLLDRLVHETSGRLNANRAFPSGNECDASERGESRLR